VDAHGVLGELVGVCAPARPQVGKRERKATIMTSYMLQQLASRAANCAIAFNISARIA
jgi:hypothetical protein